MSSPFLDAISRNDPKFINQNFTGISPFFLALGYVNGEDVNRRQNGIGTTAEPDNENEAIEFLKDPMRGGLAIAGFIVLLCGLIVAICLCWCCARRCKGRCKRRRKKGRVVSELAKQKKKKKPPTPVISTTPETEEETPPPLELPQDSPEPTIRTERSQKASTHRSSIHAQQTIIEPQIRPPVSQRKQKTPSPPPPTQRTVISTRREVPPPELPVATPRQAQPPPQRQVVIEQRRESTRNPIEVQPYDAPTFETARPPPPTQPTQPGYQQQQAPPPQQIFQVPSQPMYQQVPQPNQYPPYQPPPPFANSMPPPFPYQQPYGYQGYPPPMAGYPPPMPYDSTTTAPTTAESPLKFPTPQKRVSATPRSAGPSRDDVSGVAESFLDYFYRNKYRK